MTLSALVCLASLKSSQSEMINRFLKANQMTISTFVIVNKSKLLEHDLSPDSDRTIFVQSGHRIPKSKIKPEKFFFAYEPGCGDGYIIILPNPQEFDS